jgi:hypothetical protein
MFTSIALFKDDDNYWLTFGNIRMRALNSNDISNQLAEIAAGYALDPIRMITKSDVLRWAGSLTNHSFFNSISLEIASKYKDGSLDYDISDAMMNDLFGVFVAESAQGSGDFPSPFFDIYLAFDAGEYHRKADCSDNPEVDYTKPMIEQILASVPPFNKCSSK